MYYGFRNIINRQFISNNNLQQIFVILFLLFPIGGSIGLNDILLINYCDSYNIMTSIKILLTVLFLTMSIDVTRKAQYLSKSKIIVYVLEKAYSCLVIYFSVL